MNTAAKITFCRICLITHVKMHDLHIYPIKTVYENLTNCEITPSDDLSHHVCMYCASMLLKFGKFKEKCLKSADLLLNIGFNNKLSLDVIKNYHNIKYYQPYSLYNADSINIYPIKLEEYGNSYKINNKNEIIDNNDYDKTDQDDNYDYSNDNEHVNSFANEKNLTDDIHDAINKISDMKLQINIKNELIKEFSSDEEPLSMKRESKLKNKKHKVKETKEDVDSDVINETFQTRAEIDVITLSKEEQMKEVEDRRSSQNYLSLYYKCDLCFKGFLTEATYKNHMIRHDQSSGSYVCDICKTRWPHLHALHAHIRVSHKYKYVCRLCNDTTKNLHKAKEHQNWHNGHKFICNLCGAIFNKSTTHLTHLRLRHASAHAHTCDACGKAFISEAGLSMHRKKAHLDVRTGFECQTCNERFTNRRALNKHTSHKICGEDIKSCVKCGDYFKDDDSLKNHIEIHRKDEEMHCQLCDKTFPNERHFTAHYHRTHMRQRGRIKKNNNRKDVVCEICGFKCTSNTMLLYHQRTHSGEKPHQCTECSKSFRIYSSLQIHLRTHTGESPFKCSQCPKSFKQKAGLNRHSRVHSGVKPYLCPHCSKAFSQSNSMKLHVRTVHLKMPAPYKNRAKKVAIEDV